MDADLKKRLKEIYGQLPNKDFCKGFEAGYNLGRYVERRKHQPLSKSAGGTGGSA